MAGGGGAAGSTGTLLSYARWLLMGWVVLAFAVGHRFRIRGRDKVDNTNNILLAYQDWLGGAAVRYDEQLTARYAYLRSWSSPRQDVVVEPLRDPPAPLLFSNLTSSTDDWSNLAYAEFFGKDSIRIPPASPASQSGFKGSVQ